MMPIISKIGAKVVASRISLVINKVLTPYQHKFIKMRSIYNNNLATMVGIDYTKKTIEDVAILMSTQKLPGDLKMLEYNH